MWDVILQSQSSLIESEVPTFEKQLNDQAGNHAVESKSEVKKAVETGKTTLPTASDAAEAGKIKQQKEV